MVLLANKRPLKLYISTLKTPIKMVFERRRLMETWILRIILCLKDLYDTGGTDVDFGLFVFYTNSRNMIYSKHGSFR